MSEAIMAEEFPFVAEMPKREKTRFAKLREEFAKAKAIVAEKGMIVPFKLAAKMAGVSTQRISQLAESGRFQVVRLDDHVYVTEDSLVEFLSSERKAGRPSKYVQDLEKSGPLRAALNVMKKE